MPKLYGATVPVVFSVSRWELLGPDWRHCLRATGGQVCEWIGIFPGPALEPLSRPRIVRPSAYYRTGNRQQSPARVDSAPVRGDERAVQDEVGKSLFSGLVQGLAEGRVPP